MDELDLEFHRLITEMANSKFLEQIAVMLHHELEQFLRSVPHTKGGVKYHRVVAEAIHEHDSSEALMNFRSLSSPRKFYMQFMERVTINVVL